MSSPQRGRATPGVLAACVLAACALAGCHGTTARGAQAPSPPAATAAARATTPPAATPAPSATSTPGPHRSAPPPFRWHSAAVTAAALGKSWHAGCPVPPSGLRQVTLTFWGFDGRAHTGSLVVNAGVVDAVAAAFRELYTDRFPIRRMVPIAAYGGDDNASMAADNTSAFNCRYAVANGPKSWSMHAYGEAVDIDTLENPYTLDGRVYPPAGKPYTDRSRVRPGMIVPGSAPVRAFTRIGWGWGGGWSSSPDYQHFSTNGT